MAFPTGTSGTAVLTTAIKPKYDADFMLTQEEKTIWRQQGIVNWKDDMGPDGTRGSSIVYDVYDTMPPATTALPELADKDPSQLTLGTVTITPDEYGDDIMETAKGITESYDSQKKVMAQASGQQMAQTLDMILRDVVLGGTWVEYAGTATARTGLDTTSDLTTYGSLNDVVAKARHQGLEPFAGEAFLAPVNPIFFRDIAADSDFSKIVQYQDKVPAFKGEVGMFGGVRFISHQYGKVFLSGGQTAQSATTVATTAIAAGDVTFAVASATGLAAGDYITVGVLDALTAETVKITLVSGTDITIRGLGNTPSNFGFSLAHAVGVAVTEAANVVAIPILGKKSVWGVAGALHGGKNGDHGMHWMPTNIPERFYVAWWKWFGGYAIYQKAVIRLEAAATTQLMSKNYA